MLRSTVSGTPRSTGYVGREFDLAQILATEVADNRQHRGNQIHYPQGEHFCDSDCEVADLHYPDRELGRTSAWCLDVMMFGQYR
ncbi:hypothetical protein FIU94_18120 (plasmid) [Sulfitobacter sp. THAF37]|uniref:hypothetical protein n=1 Tax=Sulfitobacter sp. THAF37 TaxID=2587855 RepID=UPI00126876AB|nr:hypothetical protein [Sulfitobacter sp. THAF37]QFT60754.1 hypothetical protein FIU94_18120 [Sulfitobacter sp. THAF37]